MRNKGRYSQFRHSLLFRYLLIIVGALLFLPIVLPMSLLLSSYFGSFVKDQPPSGKATETMLYNNGTELEKMWHREALQLKDASTEEMNNRLQQLSEKYTHASMFWVDGEGELGRYFAPIKPLTTKETGSSAAIPDRWTADQAIAFMKKSANGDPFTVVSFVGDRPGAGQGFMVVQIPRSLLRGTVYSTKPAVMYGSVMVVLFLSFAVVSWLFFDRMRRRLLRLEVAMAVAERDGFPGLIKRERPDEIGQLEEAFNTMVTELKNGRQREQEEENLRKRLIADLSHDLRTPLTVIRSHVYNLGKESLTEQGSESLRLMDERIADLGVLIDNLLSYNLLTSGRVALKLARRDVLRLLRESAAAWYPLWEKEDFKVEIELEGEPLYWDVDETWFRRILDNLYQNIMRHARSGLYVGLSTEIRDGKRAIVITDLGKGIKNDSNAKGAGLGLSIVDLLLSRMKLNWSIHSTESGTSVVIYSMGENLNQI